MWKRKLHNTACSSYSFSPLAGIRYVETLAERIGLDEAIGFSPLVGIRYVETKVVAVVPTPIRGFSPLAGIRYVETRSRQR